MVCRDHENKKQVSDWSWVSQFWLLLCESSNETWRQSLHKF